MTSQIIVRNIFIIKHKVVHTVNIVIFLKTILYVKFYMYIEIYNL